MKKTLFSKKPLTLLVLAISLVITACSSKKNGEEENKPIALPVVAVVEKDTVLQSYYVSDIQAVKNVEIRARVQGFLEKIFVDEGKEVRKGQPLFQINDLEFRTELARAKANVSSAQAEAKAAELEVDRTRILVEKNVISKTEYDLASSKLKAAKAKIDEALSFQQTAETKLSYTFVRAPFDGILNRIPLKIGSLIDPGALLTTISDIHQVYAYFNISENEYLQYRKALSKGQEENKAIHLILADGTSYAYPGKIETIDGEFNDNTGAISFRASFPNPNKLLKHGASGKVRLNSKVENAIIIPQKSSFEIQDKNFVFVVDEKNRVKTRVFTTVKRVAQFYIVEDGLKPGEKIVYEGLQSIKDGSIIIPRNLSMDSIMKASANMN